jgi:hypothetical protein
MLGVAESDASFAASSTVLAREFQLLASLRHPNSTNVLDYGFDADRAPYFTMDLEESAQTIVDAARGAALAVQIDLLVPGDVADHARVALRHVEGRMAWHRRDAEDVELPVRTSRPGG